MVGSYEDSCVWCVLCCLHIVPLPRHSFAHMLESLVSIEVDTMLFSLFLAVFRLYSFNSFTCPVAYEEERMQIFYKEEWYSDVWKWGWSCIMQGCWYSWMRLLHCLFTHGEFDRFVPSFSIIKSFTPGCALRPWWSVGVMLWAKCGLESWVAKDWLV